MILLLQSMHPRLQDIDSGTDAWTSTGRMLCQRHVEVDGETWLGRSAWSFEKQNVGMKLAGGFKHVLFSSLFGEDSQFD